MRMQEDYVFYYENWEMTMVEEHYKNVWEVQVLKEHQQKNRLLGFGPQVLMAGVLYMMVQK